MKQPTGKWWDATFNPVTGCTPVSAGCANCWAKRMHDRNLTGGKPTPFSKITLHHDRLEQPLRWRKSRRVAVCLMGDLFHEDVPFEFIGKVFGVMVACPQHTFLVLTKRPERTAEYLQSIEELPEAREKHDCPECSLAPRIGKLAGDIEANLRKGRPLFDEYGGCCLFDRCRLPIKNVWLGTSIEDQATADERLPHLLKWPAAKRFLSIEPMLRPVSNLSLPRPVLTAGKKRRQDGYRKMSVCCSHCSEKIASAHVGNDAGQRHFAYEVQQHSWPAHRAVCSGRIDWIIVGSESGPGARPMDEDWVRSLVVQCKGAGIPLFYKQRMVDGRLEKMPMLDGRIWDEFPGSR